MINTEQESIVKVINKSNPLYVGITGEVDLTEKGSVLRTPDDVVIDVRGALPDIVALGVGTAKWSIVPNTHSDGTITTIKLLENVSDGSDEDIFELLGIVAQLGKRNPIALFKVSLASKSYNLTLHNPPKSMSVGQFWYVSGKRAGSLLQIQLGQQIDNIDEFCRERTVVVHKCATLELDDAQITTTTKKQTSQKLASSSSAELIQHLTPLVMTVLESETGCQGWVLNSPVMRRRTWEWLAESVQGKRARVMVDSATYKIFVRELSKEYDREVLEKWWSAAREDISQTLGRLIVTPLGAAKGIGASCFRVLIGPYEVVLDAGTRPKGDNPLPAFEYLNNPNLILISHAHQDHIGALPVFHREFPTAPMICTPGTREIADIMLTDCLKIQQSNEDFGELFDETDLNKTIFHLETQPVGVDFEPLPGLKVRFIHAGHIVGAACIYLRYGEQSLFYTGDYNTTSSRTTDGLRLADLPEADILITESTYGADSHPARNKQERELLTAVAEVVQAGGNVLIPAFALGRAQEIILAIRTSALFQKLKIPVYVDGLVRAVTACFNDNLHFLPEPVQNFAKQQEPFFNPDGKPPIIEIGHPIERPLAIAQPSVIIASSGMLSGGASVFYGKTLLERENAAIFISGYTDEESPGRFLQGLKKGEEIELDGKKLTVRAQVRRFNLSAHADKIGLTQVINKVNPKHLVLIHGSMNALCELASAGDLDDKYIIHIPGVGEAIEYGRPPRHISQNRLLRISSRQKFEVSIEAEMSGAWLRIPEDVLTDPRWEKLGSSGLLSAKWVGSALMLHCLNNHKVAIQKARATGEDCCAVCQSFARGKCNCADSPLFTLTVDPSAKCLEFQRHKNYTTSPAIPLDFELEVAPAREAEELVSDSVPPDNNEYNQLATTSVELEVDRLPESDYSQQPITTYSDEPLNTFHPVAQPQDDNAEVVRVLQAQLASSQMQVQQMQQLLEHYQQFLESTIGYVPDAGVLPQQSPQTTSSNSDNELTNLSDRITTYTTNFILTLKPAMRKEANRLINQFVAKLESLGQLNSDTFRDYQSASVTVARNDFILTLSPRDRKSATRLINNFVAYLHELL